MITTIRAFFQQKIATYAASKSYLVAYEGVPFKKPDSSIWLQCFVVPSTTFHRDVGCGTETSLGIFQVNVWAPKGVGTASLETAAEEVRTIFPVIPKTSPVHVDSPPQLERIIYDDSGWLILPITIKYRLEA